jgi:hypothetical protein
MMHGNSRTKFFFILHNWPLDSLCEFFAPDVLHNLKRDACRSCRKYASVCVILAAVGFSRDRAQGGDFPKHTVTSTALSNVDCDALSPDAYRVAGPRQGSDIDDIGF